MRSGRPDNLRKEFGVVLRQKCQAMTAFNSWLFMNGTATTAFSPIPPHKRLVANSCVNRRNFRRPGLTDCSVTLVDLDYVVLGCEFNLLITIVCVKNQEILLLSWNPNFEATCDWRIARR
jgi:hypothetical protein